jgi:hypothetical protein
MEQFYFIIKQVRVWFSCRETKEENCEERKGDSNDLVITVSRNELIGFSVYTK